MICLGEVSGQEEMGSQTWQRAKSLPRRMTRPDNASTYLLGFGMVILSGGARYEKAKSSIIS